MYGSGKPNKLPDPKAADPTAAVRIKSLLFIPKIFI
jgi:hypothetical protein